jgi:hypothetical protein
MNKSASCQSHFREADNGRLFGENAEPAMCDKCQELDKKIERYRSLVAKVPDPLTTEQVGKLIEEMQAQKAALHPDQQK